MRTFVVSGGVGIGLITLLACGGDTEGSPNGQPREPKIHRPTATACDDVRPAGTPSSGGGSGECASDADCTAGRNGRCFGSRAGFVCSYDECLVDAECGAGEACTCGVEYDPNTCTRSGCRVDSDCGAGLYCSPSLSSCGSGYGFSYECHTTSDECADDDDCAGATCRFNAAAGHWACSSDQCVGSLGTAASVSGLACHVVPSTQRRL